MWVFERSQEDRVCDYGTDWDGTNNNVRAWLKGGYRDKLLFA